MVVLICTDNGMEAVIDAVVAIAILLNDAGGPAGAVKLDGVL